MRSIFVDTMVLAYAVGGPSDQREPCRAILAAVADGQLELHISAEAVRELLFHRLRRTERIAAVRECRAVTAACVVHQVDDGVVAAMFDLVERTGIRGRDAIHASTAMVGGFTSIVSTDRAFDGLDGLLRVEPSAALTSPPTIPS